jgi:hypothetical protein
VSSWQQESKREQRSEILIRSDGKIDSKSIGELLSNQDNHPIHLLE